VITGLLVCQLKQEARPYCFRETLEIIEVLRTEVIDICGILIDLPNSGVQNPVAVHPNNGMPKLRRIIQKRMIGPPAHRHVMKDQALWFRQVMDREQCRHRVCDVFRRTGIAHDVKAAS